MTESALIKRIDYGLLVSASQCIDHWESESTRESFEILCWFKIFVDHGLWETVIQNHEALNCTVCCSLLACSEFYTLWQKISRRKYFSLIFSGNRWHHTKEGFVGISDLVWMFPLKLVVFAVELTPLNLGDVIVVLPKINRNLLELWLEAFSSTYSVFYSICSSCVFLNWYSRFLFKEDLAAISPWVIDDEIADIPLLKEVFFSQNW